MKLRSKIQWIFGATVAVSMGLAMLISAVSSYRTSVQIINTNMTSSAQVAAGEISKILDQYEAIAVVTGSDPVLAGEYADPLKVAQIDALAESYRLTEGDILNKYGVSIKDGADYSDTEYFAKAAEGDSFVSNIELNEESGSYELSIAAPLIGYTGKNYGAVVYRMNSDFILDILKTIKVSNNSYAYLVDADCRCPICIGNCNYNFLYFCKGNQ